MTAPFLRLPSRLLCGARIPAFRIPLTPFARTLTTATSPIRMASALPHQTDPSQHEVKLEKTAVKPHEVQADIGKMKVEEDGSFKRKASTFRDCISQGGKFAPEKGTHCPLCFAFAVPYANREIGRYHLYVSYACRE